MLKGTLVEKVLLHSHGRCTWVWRAYGDIILFRQCAQAFHVANRCKMQYFHHCMPPAPFLRLLVCSDL